MQPTQPGRSARYRSRGGDSAVVLPRYAGTILIGTLLLAAATNCRAQAQEPSTPAVTLQLVHPGGGEQTGPPLTLTLADAIERARKYDANYWAALLDAKIAHEDAVQARAAMLPSISNTTSELLTKGNGVLPSGRFVTNDGVHVYREWGVLHQDLSPSVYLLHGLHLANVAAAVANAKAEVAQRGLVVTVTKSYYELVVAQRKYATAQQSLATAAEYLRIIREQEQHGQVAHSDTIKAELQYSQQIPLFNEAQLAMDNARVALAILVLREFGENIAVIDDMGAAQSLPAFDEVSAMAQRDNPTLRTAVETLHQARLSVSAAKFYFLPTITIDADYGIEANAFALRSHVSADPVPGRVLPDLGHFVTGTITLPVFDWGANRSKLRAAVYREQQAQVVLTETQRQIVGNLYSYYNEAVAAQTEQQTLHHAAELAAESLRLIGLRYRAGESTILELVDAQNTLTQARNADDDGQMRYRLALANLQTLTGKF